MKLNFKLAVLRLAIVFGSFGALAISCEEVNPDLIGCWINVYEVGDDFYKNCDAQNFSASRFRQVYDFKQDGTMQYLVLHPTDAHYMTDAKWEFQPKLNRVIIQDIQTNEVIRILRFSIIDNETVKFEELQ